MNRKGRKEIKNWIDKGIYGLVPIYHKDGGNYTKIIFKNNPPIIVEKKINTVLVRFAAYFQKDIRLIRQQAREITGQRSMNPLPVTLDIILVPFKMRKPVGKDDGAVGYILSSAIEKIAQAKDEVRIVLRNGQYLSVLDTYLTAKHHIGYAHQVYYHLLQESGTTAINTYGLCRECGQMYNQPITKGDFVALSRNIGELVYKLDKLKK
ncbi:MAG: hypothetical protein WBI74_02040 [Caldicoprobacterales bacterium]|jgi:hypothetical protein|nr:hypothetical protein [Clostridiales bacterium]